MAWIKRIEMANSPLSFSCRLFQQLCWPKLHGDVKPHKIPYLDFFSAQINLGNSQALLRINHKKITPIASTPPPEYIVGLNSIKSKWDFGTNLFNKFNHSIVDDVFVNFVKNIAHLLQDCCVSLSPPKSFWNMEIKEIEAMHNVLKCLIGKMFGFSFGAWLNFHQFCRQFPGIIDSIQAINIVMDNLDTELLLKWLAKRRNDGKQKFIYFNVWNDRECLENLIERIEEVNLIKSKIPLIQIK